MFEHKGGTLTQGPPEIGNVDLFFGGGGCPSAWICNEIFNEDMG